MKAGVVLFAACALAATAPAGAKPKPKVARFDVTLSGALASAWRRPASVSSLGCTYQGTQNGQRELDFSTTAPVRIRVTRTGGSLRWSPSKLRALRGRDALTSPWFEATSSDCDTPLVGDRVVHVGLLAGGTVRLVRVKPGLLALSALSFSGLSSDGWSPSDWGPPIVPRLELAYGSLDERKLFARRTRTLTVTGTRSGLTRVIGDVTGEVGLDVAWTLRLRRVG